MLERVRMTDYVEANKGGVRFELIHMSGCSYVEQIKSKKKR